MAEPAYPDRDRWPEYWRSIRSVASVVLVAIPIVLVITSVVEPWLDLAEPWHTAARFAVYMAGGLVISAVARRISDLWERAVEEGRE